MNRILNCFSSAALALTLLAGCSSDSSSEGPVPPPAGEGNICGYVRCDGRGIAGVAVSDGANVVKTDAEGYYSFTSDLSSADFVRISVPSGYETARDGILPTFYAAIDPAEPGTQRFDFDLTAVDNTRHLLLVMADVHISGRKPGYPNDSETVVAELDAKQCRERFVPTLAAHAASAPAGYRVYGLNLGDMTHSEYWFRNNTGMAEYLRLAKDTPFLMYHVIGNHDHCHKYENDYEAEAEYRKYFGPTYYSFNIGKVHYVVLDDMLYHGRNKYDKIIAPEQLAWLYKDLRALDPEIRQLVVACHVPLVANNGAWDDIWYNLKNKDELFVLLQDYDVTIMTGDWHTEGTTRVSDRIVEYVHPAVTGNWWYRQGICCNGYPAAFTEYVFRGDRLESRSLIDWANGNSKRQYRVYNKGVTSNTGIASSSALDPAGGAPSVLVFFWGVAPNWTFVCHENGELTYGRGQLVQRYDPLARSLVEEGIIPYERYTWLKQKPVRLYLYTPKDPGAEIEIVGTDHIRNRDFRVVTRIER